MVGGAVAAGAVADGALAAGASSSPAAARRRTSAVTPKPERPSRRARSAGVLRPSAWSSNSRRRRPGGRWDGRRLRSTGRTGAVSSCAQGQIRSRSRRRRSTSRPSRSGSTAATGPSQCRTSGSNRQRPPPGSARTKKAASNSVPRWPSSSSPRVSSRRSIRTSPTLPCRPWTRTSSAQPSGVIRPVPTSRSARPGARGDSAPTTSPARRWRLPSGPCRAPVARRSASRARASPGVLGAVCSAGGGAVLGATVTRTTAGRRPPGRGREQDRGRSRGGPAAGMRRSG